MSAAEAAGARTPRLLAILAAARVVAALRGLALAGDWAALKAALGSEEAVLARATLRRSGGGRAAEGAGVGGAGGRDEGGVGGGGSAAGVPLGPAAFEMELLGEEVSLRGLCERLREALTGEYLFDGEAHPALDALYQVACTAFLSML